MSPKWQLRMLGIVVIALASGLAAHAETLAGTVLDPQQRVLVGASVSLRCRTVTQTRRSGARGQFEFLWPKLERNCVLRVRYPGFTIYQSKVGDRRNLIVQLAVARLKQNLTVHADREVDTPPGSVSLSHEQISAISDDPRDVLAYAKSLAGINSGADHIYVNGLLTNILPPVQAIEKIEINSDPFSAEYADGSDNHIEILTRDVDRKLHLRLGGTSMALGGASPLNRQLKSSQRGGTLQATGPVPDLPVSFSAEGEDIERHNQVALEASAPPSVLGPNPVLPPTAADSNLVANLGAYYVPTPSLHVCGNFYSAGSSDTNMNVQGWTLPQAGVSQTAGTREFRASIAQSGKNHSDRAGLVVHSSGTENNANSTALGISVPGAFTAGGAYFSRENIQSRGWLLKNVFQSSWRGRLVSFGATVSSDVNSQLEVPNPLGMLQFATESDYVASVKGGAATGSWLVTRGNGRTAYSSRTAAPFVEGELLRRKYLLLRTGLRADYQGRGGVLLSPRISIISGFHGFVVRLGSGRFVQNWANGMFVAALANDGSHLRQFLANNVSPASAGSATLLTATPIVAQIAAGLERPRDWISKVSVQRAMGHNIVPAVEYTHTAGTHLEGSRRLRSGDGWSDVLESNRTSEADEVRVRTTYKVKGQMFTANYDWIRSFDDTDGPFSFPADQNEIRAEWARSTGVSPRNLALVGNLNLGKAISLSLVEVWHGGAPLNLTTGIEQSDGLFTGRGGLPRNSGTGPSYHSLDVYATRKIPLPRLFTGSKHQASLDLAMQAQNLLGNQNYTSVGTIIGSPLFGQPLAALPGRSVRFSVNVER